MCLIEQSGQSSRRQEGRRVKQHETHTAVTPTSAYLLADSLPEGVRKKRLNGTQRNLNGGWVTAQRTPHERFGAAPGILFSLSLELCDFKESVGLDENVRSTECHSSV